MSGDLKNKVRFSSTLPIELNGQLKEYSDRSMIPISKILEQAIKKYLEELTLDSILYCKNCGEINLHIGAIIEVVTESDTRTATGLLIDKEHLVKLDNMKYPFRSQGNIHVLFVGECGHFNIKSFDGHKGTVYEDDNELMEELTAYLNKIHADDKFLPSFEIADIEKFVSEKENS